MARIRSFLVGHALLMAMAAPETGSGASAPAPRPKTSEGPGPTPKPIAPGTSAAPRAAIGGTDSRTETDPAKAASAGSAATPASPEAPAEAEKPRRGRPPKDGATATASAPKPAVPPGEMGMGALLKEAVKASEKVKVRTADLVEAADALAVLTAEMQKRLQ